jgi:hypothetical protein
MRWST